MTDAAAADELDALAEAFPPVDRDTIETVSSMLADRGDPVTFETVADVLNEAAAMGKVPDREYLQMAAAAGDYEQLDIDVNDPLDEPPDADPTSPRNAARAQEAMATIRREQFPRRAERAAEQGSIPQMIDLLETVNKWTNEALLAPDRASVPDPCKEAIETLGDAILLRIDALAAQGKRAAIVEARDAAHGMNSESFQQAIIDEANQKIRLLDNDGSDYEEVRERVLADSNEPADTRKLWHDAIENADITYAQVVELGEDVRDWLEEYHEYQQQI